MNPFKIVEEFEKVVAAYAGAPYGVAVDSCTNALLLACEYCKVERVRIPCRTYVGVACSILHAGGTIKFEDYNWHGFYQLNPYPIIDSARRFQSDMYRRGTLYCVSFHWYKHLPLGRGGMILTDGPEEVEWLRRARFDGRTEGVPPKEDDFRIVGHHCYMAPELAARGLILMRNIPDYNPDLPEAEYPDLSKHSIFTRRDK